MRIAGECVSSAMKINALSRIGLGLVVAGSLAFITSSGFAQEPTKAIAVLHPTQGSQVAGTVTFTTSGDGIKIVADVTGLTPGKHGFHIHEFGDCSSGDGNSAGGHFNPTHKAHGAPDASDRHA